MSETSAQTDQPEDKPAQEPDAAQENTSASQAASSAADSFQPDLPVDSPPQQPEEIPETAAEAQAQPVTAGPPPTPEPAASHAGQPASPPEPVTVPPPETISQPAGPAQSEIMQWRYRVLPTMQTILYIVTAVFFLSGLVQLAYLQRSILQGTKIDRQQLPSILPQFENASAAGLLEAAKFEAAVTLEAYVVERRYHQANALLMTMAWIRYLGFSTGMILAIVGASFILGMLREKQTDLAAESAGWRISLSSSSPGLIMVVLGVILMFTTIAIRQEINLVDSATYYRESLPIIDGETQEETQLLPDFVEEEDSPGQ